MNKSLILAVADAIENESIPKMAFDMAEYGRKIEKDTDEYPSHCKTVGCMAGWAVALVDGRKALHSMEAGAIRARAAELFQIDSETAISLFTGGTTWVDIINSEMAVRALRHFAKTGKVYFKE